MHEQALSVGERPLGPAGVRAIAEAFVGTGTGMGGQTFLQLKAVRLWKCNAADDGAWS